MATSTRNRTPSQGHDDDVLDDGPSPSKPPPQPARVIVASPTNLDDASANPRRWAWDCSTVFVICTSIASSVLLILTNKYLMQEFKFRYVFVLTGMHFLFGGVSLKFISLAFKSFTPKEVPLTQRFLVGASGVGSIALMNFSLQTNSVGTYQLMKLLVIPTVMAIEYFTANKTTPLPEKLSLLVLLLGVGVSTVTDISLTGVGFLFGVFSVVATAQFNIWQGSKQRELELSSTQLLYAIAFPQAAMCFFFAVVFEFSAFSAEPIQLHAFTSMECILVLMSCVMAMGVNLSSMGLIGKTSAVTYQVVGHVKTCLIILAGYLYFVDLSSVPQEQIIKNLAGVGVAMLGVFAYTYFKLAK